MAVEEYKEDRNGEEVKTGRPTAYREEYAEQARKLCLLGATNAELADFFDVTTQTINNWATRHKPFFDARKEGKDAADARVEQSLYHRAMGYSFSSEKVFNYQGQIVRAETVEHVPPDTTACIFWLKNRNPDAWRDKVHHGHSGPNDGPIEHVTREMTPQEAAEAYAATLRG